jgi:SWI/SNF-related matrix-associated actin-dependent regulator of chromatin subfamily A member 5
MSSQKNRTLSRDEMKDMLQFGASAIFKAESGTISEERIEELLSRGESKTQQLNKAIEQRVKSAALDLGMTSINIFDCFLHANKEDAEAMDEVMARELQGEG